MMLSLEKLAELRDRDLATVCTACGAAIGAECTGNDLGTGHDGTKHRHFARRLRWLIEEKRPDLMPEKN